MNITIRLYVAPLFTIPMTNVDAAFIDAIKPRPFSGRRFGSLNVLVMLA
jgi:hypothetical protein